METQPVVPLINQRWAIWGSHFSISTKHFSEWRDPFLLMNNQQCGRWHFAELASVNNTMIAWIDFPNENHILKSHRNYLHLSDDIKLIAKKGSNLNKADHFLRFNFHSSKQRASPSPQLINSQRHFARSQKRQGQRPYDREPREDAYVNFPPAYLPCMSWDASRLKISSLGHIIKANIFCYNASSRPTAWKPLWHSWKMRVARP